MTDKPQKFVSSATDDGYWEILSYDYKKQDYVSLDGKKYTNGEYSKQVASNLNKEYAEEEKDN